MLNTTSTPVLVSLFLLLLSLFLGLFLRAEFWGAKPTLRFDENSRFKIVQLADLHLGEDPYTDWAPRADQWTLAVIRRILRLENPDLVVLSGDQLTANNIDANATAYLDMLANVLEEFSVPYAMIFGNHDDADFEGSYPNGTIYRRPAKTSRTQLLRTDQRHRHSLSQKGPETVFGVSNYVLPVYKDSDVKLQIMLLDSGGGSLEQEITTDQMEWYQSQRLNGVDAVAFQHIPTKQFQFQPPTCHGYNGERGIAPIRVDPALEIANLLQDDPLLHFLAVGHNHGNSYCCPAASDNTTRMTTSHLHVCFGRHSGYGGYGKPYWLKGARVYEISLGGDGDTSIHWKSWVRLETEFIVDHYEPWEQLSEHES